MKSGSMRVIVVLGYSADDRDSLHPICAERLAHAASIATDDDVVVLSGWARLPHLTPEAALMAESWDGRARELVLDPDARSTVGNAANALDDVERTRASEVVVVTSRWHGPRAATIFRWRLRATGARIVTSTPSSWGGVLRWLSELPRWLILPIQLASGRPDPGRRTLL
ncbi:MAG: YdcF family protein [Acidimicrobiales bacterium]